jgi:hypothetical protein
MLFTVFIMKSTIFLILVWTGSSTLLRSESVAVSSASHLLRTLHGWAIVAIVISVATQLLTLESHTLRPQGHTAGLIAIAFVSCFALANTPVRKPSLPRNIRIEQPVKELQRLRSRTPSVA